MERKLTNAEVTEVNNSLESIYINIPDWSAKLIDENIDKKELSILEKMGIEKVAEQILYNYFSDLGYSNDKSLAIVQNIINAMCWNDNIFHFLDDFIVNDDENNPVSLYGFFVSSKNAIFANVGYKDKIITAVLS